MHLLKSLFAELRVMLKIAPAARSESLAKPCWVKFLSMGQKKKQIIANMRMSAWAEMSWMWVCSDKTEFGVGMIWVAVGNERAGGGARKEFASQDILKQRIVSLPECLRGWTEDPLRATARGFEPCRWL